MHLGFQTMRTELKATEALIAKHNIPQPAPDRREDRRDHDDRDRYTDRDRGDRDRGDRDRDYRGDRDYRSDRGGGRGYNRGGNSDRPYRSRGRGRGRGYQN
jgi:hypothetical protein